MPADLKTEELLKRFLQEDAEARRKGITLERVYELVLEIGTQGLKNEQRLNRHESQLSANTRDLERYGRRQAALEKQVTLISNEPAIPDWKPDPAEITGSHQLTAIQEKLAKREAAEAKAADREYERAEFWSRQRVLWVGLLALSLFAATMAGCVKYMGDRVQALEKMVQEQQRPAGAGR